MLLIIALPYSLHLIYNGNFHSKALQHVSTLEHLKYLDLNSGVDNSDLTIQDICLMLQNCQALEKAFLKICLKSCVVSAKEIERLHFPPKLKFFLAKFTSEESWFSRVLKRNLQRSKSMIALVHSGRLYYKSGTSPRDIINTFGLFEVKNIYFKDVVQFWNFNKF